jgi:hypothetical protein
VTGPHSGQTERYFASSTQSYLRIPAGAPLRRSPGDRVQQVADSVAPMGNRIDVASRAPHFLSQPAPLQASTEAVLAQQHRPLVVTDTAARTGNQGMSGFGKSVVAAALARDHEVRLGRYAACADWGGTVADTVANVSHLRAF